MSWSFHFHGQAGAFAKAIRSGHHMHPLPSQSEHDHRERVLSQLEALAAELPPYEVIKAEASGSAYKHDAGHYVHSLATKFEVVHGFQHHVSELA